MKKYRIAIYETCVEYYTVEADNPAEAEAIGWDMLENDNLELVDIGSHDVAVLMEMEG